MLDIVMLAVPGRQERTEPEYHVLLDKAGSDISACPRDVRFTWLGKHFSIWMANPKAQTPKRSRVSE